MPRKEKKVEPQELDLFNLKELIDLSINGEYAHASVEGGKYLRWCNKKYTPVYNIHPYTLMLNHNESFARDNFVNRNGVHMQSLRSWNAPSKALMQKFYDKGMFNHLLTTFYMGNTNPMDIGTNDLRPNTISKIFDTIAVQSTNSSSTWVPINQYQGVGGTGSKYITRAMKSGMFHFVRMKSKVHQKGDDLYTPKYLAGFNFLMHVQEAQVDPALNSNAYVWSEVCQKFNPLAVLVAETSNIRLIAQTAFLGGKIDPSLVELWVHPDLESTEVGHPIRTQYVRAIRNPLIKAGVKLVIKDLNEDFRNNAAPNFKTLKAEKEWIAQNSEKMLTSYAKQLYVKRATAESPVVLTSPTVVTIAPGGLVVDEHPF